MKPPQRVVITWMGTINPIGSNISDFRQNLKNNNGWTRFLDEEVKKQHWIVHDNIGVKVAAPIMDDLDKRSEDELWLGRKERRRMSKLMKIYELAAAEAITNSGLDLKNVLRKKIYYATSMWWFDSITKWIESWMSNKLKNASRTFAIPTWIISTQVFNISKRYEFWYKSPQPFTEACAAWLYGAKTAFHEIRNNEIDVGLVWWWDTMISPNGLRGFNSTKALSTRDDLTASRPWDAEVDGFVMADWGWFLVFESLEHAKKRNAKIIAEVFGFGERADHFSLTSPDPSGIGIEWAIWDLLATSGLSIEEIDAWWLHRTSTWGDVSEMKWVMRFLREHDMTWWFFAWKSRTGHTLAWATILSLIEWIIYMEENYINPMKHLHTLHPEVKAQLNRHYIDQLTSDSARSVKIIKFIINGLAFGGYNIAWAFWKYIE